MTEPEPTPGPAARTQRTAGQVGSVVVFLNLVVAFGWLGSTDWTTEQTAAILAVLAVATSAGQNTVNWWRAKTSTDPPVEGG